MRTRERVLVVAAATSLSCMASPARASGYVFSTFGGDTPAGEKLATYRSADALGFTLVSNTGFAGSTGYLRDPSIMRHSDGMYYVAYTDPIGVGCCAKVDHFSIASSANLTQWADITTVKAGVPGVAHTWAPEWFVDGTTVYVIANIDTLNTDSDFQPYFYTALDSTLTSWSGPTRLGFGPNYIDTFVLKTGTLYHAFTKNETTRYLEHATAPALAGPWTFVGTGNWSGFGPGMEGPSIVKLDDGTFRIFVDAQNRAPTARFLTSTSPDLMSWSAPVPLPGLGFLRHGTVARDMAPSVGPSGNGTANDGGVAFAPDAAAVGDGAGRDARGDESAANVGDAADDRGDAADGRGDAADGRGDATVADGEAGAGPEPPPLSADPTPDAGKGADSSSDDAGRAITPGPAGGGCSCHATDRATTLSGDSLAFAFLALIGRLRRNRKGQKSTRANRMSSNVPQERHPSVGL